MASTSILFIPMVAHMLHMSCANLLGNGDFEADPSTLGTYWKPIRSSWSISTTEAYNGSSQSVYIYDRFDARAGVRQNVDSIQTGRIYAFVGYIKLENLVSGYLFHDVIVRFRAIYINGSKQSFFVSRETRARPGTWIEIGGDFKIPEGVNEIQLFIQTDRPEVNYYFDEASLVELVPDPDWKTKAQANINSLRKSKFDIVVRNNDGLDLSNYTIQVVQNRSEFAFGTAIRAKLWANPVYANYKAFFYNTLKSEWAVLANALTWKRMEAVQGKIDFAVANATINDLRENGVKIRGHTLTWGTRAKNPDWVRVITDKDVMLTLLKKRLNETLDRTKGRLEHWEVNNENLHGDFYEYRTENPNITKEMFSLANSTEPDVKLFLNDFDIINTPLYTTAMKVFAKTLLDYDTPLDCIGTQGHFKSGNIDVDQVKYRLDKVAEAGLPIWVTELTILETNVTLKAEAMEKLLTVFFSHPSVKGVLLWGYWRDAMREGDNALAEGTVNNITLNAAGQKYVELVNTRWRTNWTRPLAQYVKEDYFKGDYTFNVRDNITDTIVNSIDVNVPAKGRLVVNVEATGQTPTFSFLTE